MKEQIYCSVADSHVKVFCVFFPFLCCFFFCLYVEPTISLDFFEVPLTLCPVTGRRLDYTIFSVDIGVTDVT